MMSFRQVVTRSKSIAAAAVTAAVAVVAPVAAFAQATVPTAVQDAIDTSTAEMQVTGYALLAVLVVVLAFKWLRRVMK